MRFTLSRKICNKGVSVEAIKKESPKFKNESEDNYRALFNKMEAGFGYYQTIFDDNNNPIDYKILDVNPSYERMSGFNRVNLVGKKFSELQRENIDYNKKIIDVLAEMSSYNMNYSKEYYDLNNKQWYKVDCFSPKPGYSASIVSDITSIKVEETSITEFIANMSHELRTPINVIFGAIQLFELYLSSDVETDKAKFKPHLASMKQNCLRLLRLVNNLIDTTKIDSGFYESNFEHQNIVEVIKRITMSVVEYASCKNIKLSFETTIEEILVMCDVDMIEKIMLNLISNAIKYTQDIIKIRISRRKEQVYITVGDNGVGIDKDKHSIIFERYKQAEAVLSRGSEGSGLGLSITKALVEMQGGQISVNSRYKNGCEIVVKLPEVKNINKKNVVTNYDYISHNHRLIEKMKIEFADIYK